MFSKKNLNVGLKSATLLATAIVWLSGCETTNIYHTFEARPNAEISGTEISGQEAKDVQPNDDEIIHPDRERPIDPTITVQENEPDNEVAGETDRPASPSQPPLSTIYREPSPGLASNIAPSVAPEAPGELMTLAFRTATGGLHLLQGWSAIKPSLQYSRDGRGYSYQYAALHTPVPTEGQPSVAVVRSGTESGRIHVFARSREGYLAHVECPVTDPTTDNCTYENILPHKVKENPKAVVLSDGTLYVFFQNLEGRLSFVRKGPKIRDPFEPAQRVVDNLADQRQRDDIACGPIWYSPAPIVRVDESGRESVFVFARDNDLFDGHIRLAILHDSKNTDPSRRLWDCRTFNGGATGPMTLGSSPAVLYSQAQKQFMIAGKEQSGNHAVAWKMADPGIDGEWKLEPSQSVADDASHPAGTRVDQAPSDSPAALNGKGFVFRKHPDYGGDGRELIMAHFGTGEGATFPARAVSPSSIPYDATSPAPAAAVDGFDNQHVFTASWTENGKMSILHFFRNSSGLNGFEEIRILDTALSFTSIEASDLAVVMTPFPNFTIKPSDSVTTKILNNDPSK